MMNVAVVGAGTIFASHVEAHRETRTAVLAVVDVDEARAKTASAQFDIPVVTTDFGEVLEREDVDIIDICTPPKFHRDIAVAALASGKHVICEKPLAASLAEVDEILEAAESSAGKLLVVHQFRCLPFYQRLKWLVDNGHLGKVHFARVQRYDPPPKSLVQQGVWGSWDLAGGGMLMTKAIHQLDMLLGLLGPVRRVQGMMGTFLCPIESEDHLTANIEFKSGALANISLSGQPYGGYGQHFDLFGSQAAVGQPWHLRRVDGADTAGLLGELESRFPVPGAPPTSGWKYLVRRMGWKLGRDYFRGTPTNMHAPLFREYFAALQHDGPTPVTGNDGRAIVELCTAIYQSALTGETVELPLETASPFYSGIRKDDYAATIAAH